MRSGASIAKLVMIFGLLLVGSMPVQAESIASTAQAELKDPAIYWGWNKAWGQPWGDRATCAPNYEFIDTTGGANCAPIAEACHPNKGQAGYSPFSSQPNCAMYTADNRYAGSGGNWSTCDEGYVLQDGKCSGIKYTCPSTGGWTLSADQQSCTRPDCLAGYTRDPNTGACLEPCPANQVRNLSTMQCEMVCDAPLIRTDANVCDCPDPLTLIDGNFCIGRDDKELGDGDCSQGPGRSRLPDWLE